MCDEIEDNTEKNIKDEEIDESMGKTFKKGIIH